MKDEGFELGQELEILENEKLPTNGSADRYFIDNSGYLCRWKQTKDGHIPVKLANFDAEITSVDHKIQLTPYRHLKLTP